MEHRNELSEEVRRAMERATTFFRDHAASHGGYVYYYSLDFEDRWGEGKVPSSTIFVQPPGTPTVGTAYLKAYEATGNRFYLEAAQLAAEALVAGQLQSGGWTQTIHFAPPERGRMGHYRTRPGGSWNHSSLDDGQTQAALNLLMRVDRALDFRHDTIHQAARFGLQSLLEAQFPNGAFPQVWDEPVPPRPILTARYPRGDWKTEGRIKDYWNHYTLNDNLAGDVAETLILAHRIYGEKRFRVALEKLGGFLILSRMPEPQPGWCQQYNAQMVPIWGRKFEPPAIAGWESQDVLETLIRIHHHTADQKYLEPIPEALDYFTEQCLLPDGEIARYYEFHTNRPLYMNRDDQLTYDDSDLPSHYGWKQEARFEEIEKAYQEALQGSDTDDPTSRQVSKERVLDILRQLDEEDRWVSTYTGERLVGQPNFPKGFRYLSSEVFSRNLETLSDFLLPSGDSAGETPQREER